MKYIDGFLLPIPKKKLKEYTKLSKAAGKIWREHGALEYRECVGHDLKSKIGIPFPKLLKPKPSEVVIFSWIIYKSKAHRDRVNAKAMNDPRLLAAMDLENMPFDCERMHVGGFEMFVDM